MFENALTLMRRRCYHLGDEQAFATISRSSSSMQPWFDKAHHDRRKRPTLMPLIALAGLSLAVTLPALSSIQVHAAQPVAYSTVTVRAGDSLWALAADRTAPGGDVQATLDAIIAANHLSTTALRPGQHLVVPR
jgi:hypothetical protein